MASVRTDAELTPSTARVGTSSPEPCGNGEESNNLELCAGPSPAALSGLAAANGVSLKTDGGFGTAPACVEIRKHPMGPVPKWGLYFYLGRGITRVVFYRPLYPAHVDGQ